MGCSDRTEVDVSRAFKVLLIVGIVLLFVLFPFAVLIGRCIIMGDCL
jgi:hypothetical protein